VAIGPTEPDEIKSDFCLQRLFIARLIERLKRLNVSVIALDKFYEKDTCPIEGDATKELLSAVAGPSPVITLARRTRIVPKHQRKPHACLRLSPGFNLGISESNWGATRLDADTRRIPLRWPLLVQDQGEKSSAETFAFVSARAANKAAVETPLLRNALLRGQQPYSTMTKIQSYSALEVLCGKNATDEWRKCSSAEPIEGMNGAIVVIGDRLGEQDTHPAMNVAEGEDIKADEAGTAPEGLLYGVDLQANYIAALLDKRYYLPLLTDFENKVFIVLFFILLQVLFWRCRNLSTAAAIGVVSWVLIFVVSLLVLAFTRYLLTVWVQGINLATIIVSWLEHWVAKMD